MKMGQNKLESDFRKKLSKREIEPSADAWNRLDAMLDAGEEKKSKNYGWLYIAAAIAAFLLIGTIFFSSEKSRNNTETGIVIEEKVKPNQLKEDHLFVNPKVGVNNDVSIGQNEVVAVRQTEKREKDQNRIIIKHKNTESVAAIQDKTPGIQSSVNQNESISTQTPAITHPVTGIDQMLAAAAPDENRKSTLKVDPNTLLSQVDGELELSFREKVIKTVSKNYQEVKVALASRNIE